jgi:hypothetical protein
VVRPFPHPTCCSTLRAHHLAFLLGRRVPLLAHGLLIRSTTISLIASGCRTFLFGHGIPLRTKLYLECLSFVVGQTL